MKKIIIIFIITLLFSGCNTKKKEIVVEDIKFDNINLIYKNGITEITGTITNTQKEERDVLFTITIDKDKTANQLIEDIKPNETKEIFLAIVGDYSKSKDINYKVVDK